MTRDDEILRRLALETNGKVGWFPASVETRAALERLQAKGHIGFLAEAVITEEGIAAAKARGFISQVQGPKLPPAMPLQSASGVFLTGKMRHRVVAPSRIVP